MMIGSVDGGASVERVGEGPGVTGGAVGEAAAAAARELVGRRVLGVGTDLVEVDEMRAVLARQPRFAARVFTTGERAYCDIPADSAERYAVRFAAKEAVLKTLGVGITGSVLTEIEVLRAPSGSPSLRLTGRAAALAEEAGIRSWLITLTHTRTLAHAFVAGLHDD
ncbi:holo-ACP synthase [Streptomyces sp. NBC_00572]|uniref:holo-ACP synthase n=1 Tax=Streptomyces sp. NBC_00572 TaxID=2903664 RepID=UPI00224F92BC|nr:holo-ACP synthase [Streptomyces sp. NBC_00572]MCX4985233.1 holo-ACP synthase [Streptomyces sp. NBC_00572]